MGDAHWPVVQESEATATPYHDFFFFFNHDKVHFI